MCQLMTFSSYIVQFAAVCGFNQASALVETCSACWLYMRVANEVRGRQERERKRSNEKDGAGVGKKELCISFQYMD